MKVIAALLAIGLAGSFLYQFYGKRHTGEPLSYFYDLSQEALFVAPKSSVPPMRGIDNDKEDAVRAVVIAKDGNCDNPKSREIAYLEMYSPELKAQFESFRQKDVSHHSSRQTLSRSQAKAHHFVQKPGDSRWYPIESRRGIEITEGWRRSAPQGSPFSVCVP
jgi:hypothetical protein